MSTVLPTERVALIGVIDPDAYTAATYTTGWIDVSKFGRVMALISAGDLGSSATLDAKLISSAASDGSSPTDVSGGAITQLTQAGTDSNKQAIINLEVDKLPENHRYVTLSVTIATATSDAAAYLFGLDARYAPPTDLTSVDEVVNV